jgi:hypothetical protein
MHVEGQSRFHTLPIVHYAYGLIWTFRVMTCITVSQLVSGCRGLKVRMRRLAFSQRSSSAEMQADINDQLRERCGRAEVLLG